MSIQQEHPWSATFKREVGVGRGGRGTERFSTCWSPWGPPTSREAEVRQKPGQGRGPLTEACTSEWERRGARGSAGTPRSGGVFLTDARATRGAGTAGEQHQRHRAWATAAGGATTGKKLGSAEGLIQNKSRPVAPECVRARGRQETLWSPPARAPAWLWLCSAPCALGSREPGQGLAMTQTLCGPQSLGHPRESRKRRPHYEAATSSACLGLALTGTFSGIFSGRGSEGTSGSSICS